METYNACNNNDLEKLKELIASGKPISSTCGYTACKNNNLAMLKILAKKGAHISNMCANVACENNYMDMLQYLFKLGEKNGAPIHENCARCKQRKLDFDIASMKTFGEHYKVHGLPPDIESKIGGLVGNVKKYFGTRKSRTRKSHTRKSRTRKSHTRKSRTRKSRTRKNRTRKSRTRKSRTAI
jgi:hypothetical protein